VLVLGRGVDTVYLDLAEAFDTVGLPHELLMTKLAGYGTSGKFWDWIRHFLMGRKQRVGARGKLTW